MTTPGALENLSATAAVPNASGPANADAAPLGVAVRSRAFNAVFMAYTVVFVLACYPLLLAPTRRPLARALRHWAKGVLWLMRRVLGIRVRFTGALPRSGAFILASKHQSEADGIAMLAQVDDVAFVAMKEVGRLPLVGPLLRKLEMVLVDTDGGIRERTTLAAGGRRAAAGGRPILIYPEGTLVKLRERGRYRAGVYHLAADLGLPVIPVATDMGRCWDRRQKMKRAGAATIAFLPPLEAGPDKRAFMSALEERIEAESARLAARCA
jgi:1-acyl-sn-glycerol-3-phosphate acyltransferase